MELKKYRLGEIVDFNKETISRQDNLLEIKYLDTSNILDNVIYETPSMKLSEAPSRAQRKVKHLTIIYSTVRPRLKHHGILQMPPENLIVSTGFATLDIKDSYENMFDATYLYLLLTQSSVTEYLGNIADTAVSAYPSINPSDISSLSFIFPDITIQRKIASIWTSYDQKIHLNSVINDNLEAMAKQLYDYWFVQFDFPNEDSKPYKSSGGPMVYNERLKREIPVGWTCCELNKWLEIKSGFAFKSETYILEGQFKVITIKNVQDHHLDTSSCDQVEEIPQGMKDWCRLSINDRLISLTGNCGRLCIVTENDLLLNQRVGLLTCDNEYIDYAYLLLSSDEYRILSDNLAKGAAQANLSPIDLCNNISVLPNMDVLKKFNMQVKPIVESYIQNEMQIAILTKQRDELLPLLMNGQVTLNSD